MPTPFAFSRISYGCAIAISLAITPLAAAGAANTSTVRVTDGWFRYITAETPAGGYMRLINPSDATAVLVSASSPACGMLMLHRSAAHGGMEEMLPVSQVAIPSGGSFVFQPGGYHLMCMSPHMRTGAQVPVTLGFKDGQSLTVPFTVYGATGKPGVR